jgi:hypothetical protein
MKAIRPILCALAFLISGCASTQLNYNTVEIATSTDGVYTKETLINLSKFIDDPYAIPTQATIAASQIQTVNSVTPSLTFPLTAPVADTTTRAATLQVASAHTTAGAGAGLTANNGAQQNYTIAPLNDANTLRNLQALYRHAVYGAPLLHSYHPPRIFFQDKFYDDPYSLQLPHCVICAVHQGEFSSIQKPAVYVNKALKGKWLYWEGDPRTAELIANGDAHYFGHYGNHDLYMSQSDYETGVLSNFVIFTLPNSEPVETFAAAMLLL